MFHLHEIAEDFHVFPKHIKHIQHTSVQQEVYEQQEKPEESMLSCLP